MNTDQQKYPFEMIRTIILALQAQQGPMIAKMIEVQTRYDGDYVIPLPDVKNEPKLPQLTPALVGEAVDQIALRAASVHPMLHCPAINPSRDRGVRSREYATIREMAISGTLEKSRWMLGRRRFYRHLTAYHTSAVAVVPDFGIKMPRIETRDPLSAFAEPLATDALRDPNYAAFVTRMSGAHLRSCYPKACSENGGPISPVEQSRLWEVAEWYDEEAIVYGLMGPCEIYGEHVFGSSGTGIWMELSRVRNRAGQPPVVVPHNVSLGRIASRIAALLGNIDLQAKLMALYITAQEKGIFPDTYAIGRENSDPELVNGAWKDGRTGEINLIRGADQVGVLRNSPDQGTGMIIDRLERNVKTSTSLIPQLGGESYGALRTGRGIDSLAGIALDPRIQEAHEITEAYMPKINEAILATYKGWWPNKQYSMYAGKANTRSLVEFVPSRHFETFESSVSYVLAGADVAQLTMVLGQLRGMKAIAQRTLQDSHPMIGNSDVERAQIREEDLEEATLNAILQQVNQGALPPTVAGMIYKHLKAGKNVFDAIDEAQKELQRLQATQAPPPQDPMMVAPPESMPGLTGGPMADQQPIAAAPPAIETPQGVSKMRELMAAMGAG